MHVHTSAIKNKNAVLLEARMTIVWAIENLGVTTKDTEASLNETKMDVTQFLSFTVKNSLDLPSDYVLLYM